MSLGSLPSPEGAVFISPGRKSWESQEEDTIPVRDGTPMHRARRKEQHPRRVSNVEERRLSAA